MTPYLVERLAELRRHLDHLRALRFSDQDAQVIQPVTVNVTLTTAADVYTATTFDNYNVNGLAGNDSISTVD